VSRVCVSRRIRNPVNASLGDSLATVFIAYQGIKCGFGSLTLSRFCEPHFEAPPAFRRCRALRGQAASPHGPDLAHHRFVLPPRAACAGELPPLSAGARTSGVSVTVAASKPLPG
jgi:hypothetical protein